MDAESSSGTPGAAGVGQELRAARQAGGWRLHEFAAWLRIQPGYLEAIEDGRIADMPAPTYAVGFVRQYAGALGLDADAAAARFRAGAPGVNQKTELAFPAPVADRGVPAGVVVLLGLLLAAGAYGAWYRSSSDARPVAEIVPPVPERLAPLVDRRAVSVPPAPSVAEPAPVRSAGTPTQAQAAMRPAFVPTPAAPVVAAPVPPVPPAVVPLSRVVVRVNADSKIEVREQKGPVLLSRVLHGGETWPVPEQPHLLLATSNAGATELLVDGVAMAPLGRAGASRRNVVLDADAIKGTHGVRRP